MHSVIISWLVHFLYRFSSLCMWMNVWMNESISANKKKLTEPAKWNSKSWTWLNHFMFYALCLLVAYCLSQFSTLVVCALVAWLFSHTTRPMFEYINSCQQEPKSAQQPLYTTNTNNKRGGVKTMHYTTAYHNYFLSYSDSSAFSRKKLERL